MKRLRKQVKAILAAVAITAFVSAMPSSQKKEAHFPIHTIHPAVIPEEKIPLAEIHQPVTLKEYQSLNAQVKYLLVFQDEKEERRIPVIATDNAAYALNHDLLGRSEKAGTAFTDITSYVPVNLVIYGHSSSYRDVQLTFLKKMKDTEYYRNHSVFVLEDEKGEHPCQIVSMGEYDMTREDTYTDWALPEYENKDAVKEMFQKTSQYLLQHTDGIVYQNQQIITLVTCNTDKEDTRYVIQALYL